MALKAAYEIRCSCGEAFTGDIYEYVFVDHDPELKDAILSGEFNRVPCPACGERLSVENRFLYRDERNRLWVWVCRKDEESGRGALIEDLLGKNTFVDCHFLDDGDAYRKHIVFGRDDLLELLWKEDRDLKKMEEKHLKKYPAYWWGPGETADPGFILFTGKNLRVSMPLRFPEASGIVLSSRKERIRWLEHYAQGMNVHNPYSSFLDKRLISRWDRIREKEPLGRVEDGFADFAETWAGMKIDARRFSTRYPERYAFFESLRKRNVSRTVRPLNPGKGSRKSPGRR